MKTKTKISIAAQVFLALITIIFVMGAIFSPYGFYTNIHSIRNSLDERLKVASYGVNQMLPPDYVDNAVEGKISPELYKQLFDRLIELRKNINVTYLYVMVEKDGKIYFVLDQDSSRPMMVYEDPSNDTLDVFKKKSIVFAECEDDEFGIIARTVLVPFVSEKGQFYVVGADLNVTNIYPIIRKSILDFIILLSLGVVLVIIITARLTKRISNPIQKLSLFTQKLSESNFSPDLKIEDTVPQSIIRTNELSILVSSIDTMQTKLAQYIENLKKETLARNLAESELKIAGGIQNSFLPGTACETDYIVASAAMKPAKQAGGDLYDFFEMSDGKTCFAIGDTAGKGMPAALFMARAMTLIRSAAYMSTSLKQMVKFINDMLSESNESCTFITFFICAYNPKTGLLEYVNCGHNPAYIMRANGSIETMPMKTNRVLGVFGGIEFEEESIFLNYDDTLVCYTDGVPEAISADGSFYGDEHFIELLNSLKKKSVKEITDEIMASVITFESGCEQSDDITLLAIRRKSFTA